MKENKDQRVSVEPETHLTREAVGADTVARVTAAFQSDPPIGAVVSFVGVVREDRHEQGTVEAIEFTALEPAAEKAIRDLSERLAESTPGERVRLHVEHRLGTVPAGEAPIVIVVGAGHRKETFELCSSLLEALKAEVPIYGKELLDSGKSEWKVNH